ncbi:MAG: thermostable hemolysin [Porticoccaceae bacterium]
MINKTQPDYASTGSNIARRKFVLNGPTSRHRSATEEYIKEGYQRCYQAKIGQPMPLLLSLTVTDTPRAALGLRPAGEEQLFLENYLDNPIESTIASAAAQPIMRDSIVEIGNLVATQRVGSQLLFIVMTAALAEAGFHWITFTATPQVVKLIVRLGFTPLDLGAANPDRLIDEGASWGSYFQTSPRIQAGLLKEAMAALQANHASAEQLSRYRETIAQLAVSISAHKATHRAR